jgi:hypothetical protein
MTWPLAIDRHIMPTPRWRGPPYLLSLDLILLPDPNEMEFPFGAIYFAQFFLAQNRLQFFVRYHPSQKSIYLELQLKFSTHASPDMIVKHGYLTQTWFHNIALNCALGYTIYSDFCLEKENGINYIQCITLSSQDFVR